MTNNENVEEFLKSLPSGYINDHPFKTKTLTDDERITILKNAEKDALHSFYKTMFLRQYVSDFMTEGITPLQHLESKEQKQIIDRARDAVISKSNYALITINPTADITQEVLTKCITKFVSRKLITSWFYVYEVRKEDFSGLHCHMIVYRNSKPNDLKRGCQNTFKNICDVKNPSILNIKYIDEENIINQKIPYLLGHKQDKKKPGIDATIKYRLENNLLDFYESTPPLPCRGAEKIALID